MKRSMLVAASGAALTFSLALAGAAPAQELGLKQLQDSAVSGFAQLGLDTAPIPTLTLDELAQIEAVNNSSDPDDNKTRRIQVILADAETRIATEGYTEPRGAPGDITAEDLEGDMVVKANVGAYLAQLGMADQIDVESLTTEELLQVQLIQGTNDSEEEKRTLIEELVQN